MATSGAMSTNTDKIAYKITITQNSQSVANNTTNVTVSVRVYRTNTGYTSYGTGTVYCTINGTQYTEGITPEDKITSSGIVLFSKKLNIAHNADGTKTLTVSARITHDVFSSNNQSFSVKLTTIPRATTPKLSATSANMGASITITMSRASSAFTHTLTYKFINASGSIGSGLGTSKAWTIPLSLASQIPAGTSGTCTITCKTYNGGTLIGTKTVSFTAKVPTSVAPSISSLTAAEAVAGLAETFGAYVQNKSKVKVAIKAAGSYGSTIKAYKTTLNGKSYTGSSPTSSVITASGTVTVTASVTDSRGRTASKTIQITVLPYKSPKIEKFSVYRADAGGVQDYESKSVKCMFSLSVSPVGDKNNKAYKLEYKKKAAAGWELLYSGAEYLYNGSMIFPDVAELDSSYDLRLTVSDYFSAAVAVAEIPTAFTLIDYHAGGRGIAFGKVSEVENRMEIDMDLNIYREIYMGGEKRSDDEKNMYFQSMDTAKNVHNCKIYGGNGNSATSIGCWDSLRSIGIWRYLGGTKNMVIDANVALTHGNGGDEFVTTGGVTHGSRTGRVHFSNGLLIQWGVESIVPDADKPTKKAVTFPVAYTDAPAVVASPQTTVPGTSVTGAAAAAVSATGFDAYVTRTNDTATSVAWIAIGYRA